MKKFAIIFTMCLLPVLSFASGHVKVRWEMGKEGMVNGNYTAQLTITNVSDDILDHNWQFYFNQVSRHVKVPQNSKVDLKEVAAAYFQICPNEKYEPLAPGESFVVDMAMPGPYMNVSYTAMGGVFVPDSDMSHAIAVKIELAPLVYKDIYHDRDITEPNGTNLYDFNAQLSSDYKGICCYDIFPAVKQLRLTGGYTNVSKYASIVAAPGMERASRFLKRELMSRGIIEGNGLKIQLILDNAIAAGKEYYKLVVRNGSVTITAASDVGALNGVKTFIASLDHRKGHQIENAIINDYPDMEYRGFMLDIARNFTNYEGCKRLIDLFSYYKINKFQFHFTDDEAWRLEIPGLPELTEVASRRGCAYDDKDYLPQVFDGNGDPDDLQNSANGYITRDQMIDLIKYAHERGVEIIPEFDTPGHSRAAIIAMRARYRKYAGNDDVLANQYKLWDDDIDLNFPTDLRYKDNVLNVAQPGVYNFVFKVIDEIEAMYREAGVPLLTMHMGGDEVPAECWNGSPVIQAYMTQNNLKSTHEVSEEYVVKVSDYLKSKGIAMGAWQEVGLNHSDAHNALIAPRFSGVSAWSTLGKSADTPIKLANAGYRTIVSNVSNLYFDMAYSWNPYEKGLMWGGAVTEYDVWASQPRDLYRMIRHERNGTPIDVVRAGDGRLPLEKPQNVIGMQGQLWAETIRNFDQVQYAILPRLFGLSHRAWNTTIEWDDNKPVTYTAAQARFNAKVGAELCIVNRHGYNFRLGQPGVKIENGMLLINKQYNAEKVRYTLDGSEPINDSPEWTAPVAVDDNVKVVKAKAFWLSHTSLTTYLNR